MQIVCRCVCALPQIYRQVLFHPDTLIATNLLKGTSDFLLQDLNNFLGFIRGGGFTLIVLFFFSSSSELLDKETRCLRLGPVTRTTRYNIFLIVQQFLNTGLNSKSYVSSAQRGPVFREYEHLQFHQM